MLKKLNYFVPPVIYSSHGAVWTARELWTPPSWSSRLGLKQTETNYLQIMINPGLVAAQYFSDPICAFYSLGIN